MIRQIFFSLIFLAACGDNLIPSPDAGCDPQLEPSVCGPDAIKTVTLWVEDDPVLDKSVAVAGCDLWGPVHLQCQLVAGEIDALAKIHASHGDCKINGMIGGYILASAGLLGDVTVNVDCMSQLYGHSDDGLLLNKMLKLVVGHEIGHETGMPYHVPATCNEADVTYEYEKDLVRQGICGPALMNAILDPNVTAITQFDVDAYRLRWVDYSNFPQAQASETPGGCILTSRPAP
jgi:hypothetical protein